MKARRPSPVMPRVAERTTGGKVASFLIHAIAILLLFLPAFNHKMLQVDMEGAGGAGPAGGGGGGHQGSGGVKEERLTYVSTAPQPALVVPKVIPPVVEKKPDPVVTPPPPVVTPPPEPTKADSASKATAEATAPVIGTGGGTGNDGTNGTGPGTGGGKGSGVGTGTGSSVGPGTGGGNGMKYKASVTTLVILPLPLPAKVKPYVMRACFEVDSIGHQTLLEWTKSKDAAYNKKVEESLRGYRFRPAVLPNGTAVRDTTCVNASGG
jgi:protein TonB